MDFSSAADDLYGVPPADFVEARTRLAREARAEGDAALAKRIGALRRPTLSAWAVNLLARSAAGDLADLLDVGEEMRAAWGSGRGLGDLERRRARLVGSLVRAAGELAADAGNALREQAVREVEDTLQAATVDAGIAEEVREGRLSQPRSHSGFVPAGFAAGPPDQEERAKPKPKEKPVKAKPPAEKKKAEGSAKSNVARTSAVRAKRAETLRKRAEQAEDKLADREEQAEAARSEAQEASAKVGHLRRELERAIAERDAASRRADRAEQNRARAEEAAREARRAATEARRAAARDPHPG